MIPPRRISQADQQLSASNFNHLANAVRRGETVGVSGDLTRKTANGRVIVGRSNRLEPEFLAGFKVEQLSPTKVKVSGGYSLDIYAGPRLWPEVEFTIDGECYLYAQYTWEEGWNDLSGNIVQQRATMPDDDDVYYVNPIAKITWWGTPSNKIREIIQYDIGNLVGMEQQVYSAFFAKITGRSGREYEFVEQTVDNAGTFSDRVGGFSGGPSGSPAWEASGLAVDLAEGIIVPMVRVIGAAGVGDNKFVFTLAHWLAEDTTTLDTSDMFEVNDAEYIFPRTENLEIPIVTRQYQEGPRLALFMRTMKLDANGNIVSLSGETKVLDSVMIPTGINLWDVLTWDGSNWIPGPVRGHS